MRRVIIGCIFGFCLLLVAYAISNKLRDREFLRQYIRFPKVALVDMLNINEAIIEDLDNELQANDRYAQGQNIEIPSSISIDGFISYGISPMKCDPWGSNYRVLIKKSNPIAILIISNGPDKKANESGKYQISIWKELEDFPSSRIRKENLPKMDDIVMYDGRIFCGPDGAAGIGYWGHAK